MKIVGWIFALLLVFVALFGISERVAAERVEVVELHTQDQDGNTVTTRLWVVDYDGNAFLRVGGDGSGWFSRLSDSSRNPLVQVTRGDQTGTFRAVPEPDLSEQINALMQEKYTWGDSFIGSIVGGRKGSIPIRLIPAG